MVVLRDGEGFAGNAPDGQVAQRGRLLRVVGQRQVVHIPHCGVEALLSAVDDEDGIVAAVGEDGMLPVGVVVDDVKAVFPVRFRQNPANALPIKAVSAASAAVTAGLALSSIPSDEKIFLNPEAERIIEENDWRTISRDGHIGTQPPA